MKLENARGTRDFLPEEKIRREQIISILKESFELFGYSPLETPALERFDVLSSKYAGGSEILKETFRLTDQGKRELGMRYDLTVPLSRVVGQNPNLKLPFKRYQIEKVWRDGPVSLGRYREFLQADIDIIGVKSMSADAEMIEIAQKVFENLRMDITIKVNSRKILNAIIDYAEIPEEKKVDVIIAIDKMNKVGIEGVEKELEETLGIPEDKIEKIISVISIKGKNEQKIVALKLKLKGQDAEEGLNEIEELLNYADFENLIFDVSLARGLSYYTGTIFEVMPNKGPIKSSVAGGGRYDKMISLLLDQKTEYPAVGISFGVDRLLDAVPALENKKTVAKIFIIPIQAYKESLDIARRLRSAGIKCDIDLQGKGPSRNLNYANSLGFEYVLFIGETEIKQNKFKLKNMKSGEEKLLFVNDIIDELKE